MRVSRGGWPTSTKAGTTDRHGGAPGGSERADMMRLCRKVIDDQGEQEVCCDFLAERLAVLALNQALLARLRN